MSVSQTLLAVGAILILMNVTMTLNRSYVLAISDTIELQNDIEAIQFAQALSESVFSLGNNPNAMVQHFGQFNDINEPANRIEFTTALENTLYAALDISDETTLSHGVTGRVVTITVYSEDANQFELRAQNIISVNQR